MKNCEQCGNEYAAKRSTSKYCSTLCRKLAFQNKDENAKVGTLKTEEDRTLIMTPEGPRLEVPANYGLNNCECWHCAVNKRRGNKHVLNHGTYKDAAQLADNELNRLSLPGDVDYEGAVVCDECRGKLEAEQVLA